MSDLQTIKLPDIGDIDSVEVIEVLVREGDQIKQEDSLIAVESDKASMEIPAPFDGTITAVLVKPGQQVSQGSDLVVVDVIAMQSADSKPDNTASETTAPADPNRQQPADTPATPATDNTDRHYEMVVLGAGPGGYTAAFRAADLGKQVLLIERYPDLGGVCLNVGCIPSKALLHTAQIINEVDEIADHGVSFGKPKINLDKLRGFKEQVIGQLTGGLKGLTKQRNIDVLHGVGSFASPHSLNVQTADGEIAVGFDQAVIAAGSQSIKIPGFPYDDDRLMDSTGALQLADIPKRLLIIGGGIIGLEMGCVYAGLGSAVTVVELSDTLMPGTDRDLVKPLQKRLDKQFENIFVGAKVTGVVAESAGLSVNFEGGKAPATDTFDRVLLAVGRSPNGNNIAAENAGVQVDERGFIAVDGQMRSNVPHIFAIGDIVGQPMLAHKATHEGKTAAEVSCGMKSWFDAKAIPSVAYTDPEIA